MELLRESTAAVPELSGLEPVLRFELELVHGVVPVAQVICVDFPPEYLEHAQGQHPAGAGRNRRVLLEIPGRGLEERELEPGLWPAVRPGPRRQLTEIRIQAGALDKDPAVHRSGCGAG